MDKKSIYIITSVIILTFVLTFLIRFYRPDSAGEVNFDNFPLTIGNWQGSIQQVGEAELSVLNPQAIFSAYYSNPDGVSIHLLLQFFSSDATYGGPHSPRNCLPGSGWTIESILDKNIITTNRTISAGRFELIHKQSDKVMDFWYVTHLGETSNDYLFKLYELIAAVTFRPRDVAFIRFVTSNNSDNQKALDEFQQLIMPEIYKRLPF